MTMCRACLKSLRTMIPFDEKYIMYFNILTGLNIKLSNDEPQKLCKRCYQTLQRFVEFREKCIAADSAFSDIIPKESIKTEDEKNLIIMVNEIIDYHGEEEDSKLNFDDDLSHELILKIEDEKCKIKNITRKTTGKIKCIKDAKSNLPCGLCTKSFESKPVLELHLLVHKKYNTCTICFDRFIDWQELLSHRLMHLPGKQHSCHLCTKRFKTPPYLEYHYRRIHSDGEKHTLRCKYCDRSYNTPKQLQGHITVSHNTDAYCCDYCNKLYSTKSILRAHIVTHMDRKPYFCNLCDYTCKFSSNLKAHKISKHNPARVYCSKCKRVFGSQSERNQHTCRETSTVCPICGKVCKDKKLLNQHLYSHDEVGRYKCDRCPATFKCKVYLDVHRNKHDGIRKYVCEYCPAKFYFSSVLTKHRRTHTGVKPYVCKVCQKAFTGNNNLKVHMRVHGEYLITKKSSNEEEAS